MEQQPRNNFRTQAVRHFLTYPQCDIPLEEMLKQLKDIAGNKYGWCVISAEDHEERENDTNVGVHRHVMQEYTKKQNIRDPKYWDLTWQGKTYHPHFEPVKNKAKCLQYVIKDGIYIVDGTYKDSPFSIDVYLESTKTKAGYGFTYAAKAIKEGKTIQEIDEEVPGFVMNHKRKIEEYAHFQAEKKAKLQIKPKFYGFEDVDDPAWQQVVEWANTNFLQPRLPRQKQLWLWSDAFGIGKSYPWLNILPEYYKLYEWQPEKKQSEHFDDTIDYIVMDEFHGSTKISDLKRISQMYGMTVDRKYSSHYQFKKNVPLIITSNHPPKSVYKNCYRTDVESLEDRFLVVQVDCKLYLKPKPQPLPPQEQDSQDFPTPPYNPQPPPIIEGIDNQAIQFICSESLDSDAPTPKLTPVREEDLSSSFSESSEGDSMTTALEKIKSREKRKNNKKEKQVQKKQKKIKQKLK